MGVTGAYKHHVPWIKRYKRPIDLMLRSALQYEENLAVIMVVRAEKLSVADNIAIHDSCRTNWRLEGSGKRL